MGREAAMLFLKSCPRCQGDMHVNDDLYGRYKECLQCGYMRDIEDPEKVLKLHKILTGKSKVA
jgi:DNA-directed RNA polymerase subunit M/transcription elongation factor TFIIS